MSQAAEELLNSSADESAVLGVAKLGTMALGDGESTIPVEEHIVIGSDRFIRVPDALKRIAVQFDHNVETVTFDCPRYWDGLDMSTMTIYINYRRADNILGSFKGENVTVDETDPTIMHFTWKISKNVTKVKGTLVFLICVKKTDDDGNEENHWNSELNEEMYISEGLEVDEVAVENYPDLITQLLDQIEADVRQQVDEYFVENPLYTDSTLTESGAAADAKVVGEKFTSLEETVTKHDNQLNSLPQTLTSYQQQFLKHTHDIQTNANAIEANAEAIEKKAESGHKHSAEDIDSGTMSEDRLPTVSVAKGGTGKESWTPNGLIYPHDETTMTQMTAPTEDRSILQQDMEGAPRWVPPDEFFTILNGLRVMNGSYVGRGVAANLELPIIPVLLVIYRPNLTDGNVGSYAYRDAKPALLVNGSKDSGTYSTSATGTTGASGSLNYQAIVALNNNVVTFSHNCGSNGESPAARYMNESGVTYNWVAIY